VLGDAELVGFTTRHMGFGSIGLAEIIAGQGMAGPISLGPVRYVDVEVGDGRVVQCVESALLLAVREEAPLALVLSRGCCSSFSTRWRAWPRTRTCCSC
jgi:hypothetical protein